MLHDTNRAKQCVPDENHKSYAKEPNLKMQAWIASRVILGNILIGYSLGWSAPVTRKLQDVELTPLPFALTEGEASWVASIMTLGVIAGANSCGCLSNVIGRKPCLIMGGMLIFLGYVFVTAALSLNSIHAGRVLTGLGVGSMVVTNLVYLGEIASKSIRGFLLASTGVMHTVGCLIAYSVGPFVSYYTVGGVLLALSAVYIAGSFTIPESPMFYVIQGSSVEPNMATIILGTTEVLGTMFTPILIEKMGRKALTLISTSGCCICMTVMGIYFYLELINHHSISSIRWLPLILLVLNLFFYNSGLNVVPSTLIGEMFSSRVRSTGSCISMTTGLVFGFLSGVTFGYLVTSLGSHVMFWNFAVVNCFGFIFCLIFMPETKGKSLAEIEALLAK